VVLAGQRRVLQERAQKQGYWVVQAKRELLKVGRSWAEQAVTPCAWAKQAVAPFA
jgi:hypothetical protein